MLQLISYLEKIEKGEKLPKLSFSHRPTWIGLIDWRKIYLTQVARAFQKGFMEFTETKVRIQSHTASKVNKYGIFSGLFFPNFDLNKGLHSINLRFCANTREYWPESTLYLDAFHLVLLRLCSFFSAFPRIWNKCGVCQVISKKLWHVFSSQYCFISFGKSFNSWNRVNKQQQKLTPIE